MYMQLLYNIEKFNDTVAYDYGWNSGTPLRDAVASLKKNSSAYGTVYYLNRDNPVPNCPNSYALAN